MINLLDFVTNLNRLIKETGHQITIHLFDGRRMTPNEYLMIVNPLDPVTCFRGSLE